MSRRELYDIFAPGCSPYTGAFTAAMNGYTIDEVSDYCQRMGIALRPKDVENWENGNFIYRMNNHSYLNPIDTKAYISPIKKKPREIKLEDFLLFPDDWEGTTRRFFPTNNQNKPMCKWGWMDNFTPQLYRYNDAKVMSPCGWVGQNMIYQRFVVMDIDGVGHGCLDESVIAFGNLFKDKTLSYEDPNKKGSFHLYFKTDRLIPTQHFAKAKLDFIGNTRNYAVYFKNKISNGMDMAELTPEIWNAMMAYVSERSKGE